MEGYNLYYWREKDAEVDFVIEYGGVLVGIEVKSGRRSANRGMTIFAEKFNPQKVIVVGTGGISLDEFLSMNPADLLG